MNKIFFLVGAFLVVLFFFVGCDNRKFSDEGVEKGYLLAQEYCQSCHQFPDPGLLNKSTWVDHVLPKMGELVGFRSLGMNSYIENGKPTRLKLKDWNNIVRYYTTQAPQVLPNSGATKIILKLKQFTVSIPAFGIRTPATTMVCADLGDSTCFFADAVTEQVYLMAGGKVIRDSFRFASGVSGLKATDTTLVGLTMGVLYPSDSKAGKLMSYNVNTRYKRNILDSLQRPVHASYADLNNDSLEDIIICEFGNTIGQLSWFESQGNTYKKHVLRALPGAIKTQVLDFNKDGKPDIMAMMAQGDEGIFIYYNQGDGQFSEKRILQFPPSYGSNYFEVADFNKDGHPDIITTAGDNGDYPPILKNYHGIRIYFNDGQNNFKEKLFLAVNGVGKAVARDFDGDGDLDIASISFFPDYSNTPEESFVYWENTGQFKFEPYSFPEALAGRWITMDAGDVDADGDMDIVLGNATFSIGNVPAEIRKTWDAYSPSIITLVNTFQTRTSN